MAPPSTPPRAGRPARSHHSRNAVTLSSSTSASTAALEDGLGSAASPSHVISDRSIRMPPSNNSLLTRNGRASLSSLGIGASSSSLTLSGAPPAASPAGSGSASKDVLASLGLSLSDVLSSDPDSLFMIHNVRSLTAIQEALGSLVDATSEDLRGFVGQRYRDLLGTADTVIDMGMSAEALVSRLDKVREGVERAINRLDEGRASPQAPARIAAAPASAAADGDERNEMHELAAALKLVQEAPEAVARALEALQQRTSASGKSAASTSAPQQPSRSAEASLHKADPRLLADHALRASLILVLADKAWHWACRMKHARIKHRFSYVSSQHASLHPLQASLRRHIRSLLGTLVVRQTAAAADSATGTASSKALHHATTVLLLSLRVLDPAADALEELLDARSDALRRRTRDSHRWSARDATKLSPAQRARRDIADLIRASSQTILHALRAFSQRQEGSEFERAAARAIGSALMHDGEAWIAALRTLPSAALFESHLPRSEILAVEEHPHGEAHSNRAPAPVYDTAAVIDKLQEWHTTYVRDTLAHHVASLLAPVRSLQHLAVLRKALRSSWGSAERAFESAFPGGVQAGTGLAERAKGMLKAEREEIRRSCRRRAEGVQEERMKSIAEAFQRETVVALRAVKEGSKGASLDTQPLQALFTPSRASNKAASSSADPAVLAQDAINDLKRALRGRPPLIDSVVRGAEQGLSRLWAGLVAYGSGGGDEEGDGEEERVQLWKAHETAAQRLVGTIRDSLRGALESVAEPQKKEGLEGYRIAGAEDVDGATQAEPELDDSALRSVAFIARLSGALSSSQALARCVSGPQAAPSTAEPSKHSLVSSELSTFGQLAFDVWKAQQVRRALELFARPSSKGPSVVDENGLVACLAFLARELADFSPPAAHSESSLLPARTLMEALLDQGRKRGVEGLEPLRALLAEAPPAKDASSGKSLWEMLQGKRLLLEPLLGAMGGEEGGEGGEASRTPGLGNAPQGEVKGLVRLARQEGEESRWAALAV